MTETTAADAEALSVEFFVHNWVTPEGAGEFRRFLAERLADEWASALERRGRGERGDIYGEVRRLTEWTGTVDLAAAHKAVN